MADLPNPADVTEGRRSGRFTALAAVAVISITLNVTGIVIGMLGFQRATDATSANKVAIVQLRRAKASITRLTATSTSLCARGNEHRAVTNQDAHADHDVLLFLAHPAGRSVDLLSRAQLRRDLNGLRSLPQIDCAKAVGHPLTYVPRKPQPFSR